MAEAIETPQNTYALIAGSVSRDPTREALLFLPDGEGNADPVRLTAQELLAQITRAANMFRRLGAGPDDVISFLLPNVLQVQFAFWGAEAAGIVNPINFLLSAEQIADVMNAAGTKLLVTLGPHPVLRIWEKALAAKDLVPSIQSIVAIGGVPTGEAYDFDALLKKQSDAPLPGIGEQEPDTAAALFHTGGTTGAPKLVRHSHRNQVHAAFATAQGLGYDASDTVMCGMPMFHVAAPMLLSLAPMAAGARIVMPTAAGNRDPKVLRNFWDIVDRCGATVLGGVPTTLADILAHGGAARNWPDRRMRCVTGGAQITKALQKRFTDETGFPVHQVYGMTETASIIAVTPHGAPPPVGSAGKAAAGVSIRIVPLGEQAADAECAVGEAGVIWARGPNVAVGYWSRGAISSPLCDAQGWLNSGDLGYLDGDGWLFITGRAKDVIIRSGHNIDPAAIEEIAERHAAVRQAVAVGRPDPRAGEVPVLFVTLEDGAQTSPDDIAEFVIENITEAPAKPVAVYIRDEVPLTAIGKVFRPALRNEAILRLVADKLNALLGDGHGTELAIDELSNHAVRLLIRTSRHEIQSDLAAWLAEHNLECQFA